MILRKMIKIKKITKIKRMIEMNIRELGIDYLIQDRLMLKWNLKSKKRECLFTKLLIGKMVLKNLKLRAKSPRSF